MEKGTHVFALLNNNLKDWQNFRKGCNPYDKKACDVVIKEIEAAIKILNENSPPPRC